MRSAYEMDGEEFYLLAGEATECRDCGQSLSDDEREVGVCNVCVWSELDPATEPVIDDEETWINEMLARPRYYEEN